MTIASGTVKAGPYEGNAAATSFAFTFKCFQSSDLLVVHYDGVGTETELTEGVDYSVTLNGDQEASPGGSVTYPLGGSPLPATEFITIVSSVAYTQGLDLILGGNWNPDSVEQALDRLTLMAAQNKEAVDRSLKVGIGTGISPDAFAADIEAQADAALNSAIAAANSAGNAGTSETNAGISENNALAYLEAIRDHWLGASATDPALDGNGDALTDGDLYWNTAVPEFRVYSSGAWVTYLDHGVSLSTSVSLKSFGAIGDGVTDDTAALNAAIAANNASDNGTMVFVPEGIYLVTADTTQITKPMSFFGAGRSIARFLFQGCNGLNYDLSASSVNYINVTLADLTFLSEGTTWTGVYFRGKQTFSPHDPALVVRGCTFNTSRSYSTGDSITYEWAIGLNIYDTDEVLIDDCFFNGSSNNANWTTTTGSIGIKVNTATGVRIVNTQIFQLGTGIECTGQSEGMIAQGLTIVACKYGFNFYSLINPSNNHVISDTHIAAYLYGVRFADSGRANNALGVALSNLFLLERGMGAVGKPSYTAIYFHCRFSTIKSVMIHNNNTGTADRYGITASNAANVIAGVTAYNAGRVIQPIYSGDAYKLYVTDVIAEGDVTALVYGGASWVITAGLHDGSERDAYRLRANTFAVAGTDGETLINCSGARTLLGGRDESIRYIDFRSVVSGNADYDARIIARGGHSTLSGRATMEYYGTSHALLGPAGVTQLKTEGARTLLGARDYSTRYIDFRSYAGGAADYDARILSSSGHSSTAGQASLLYHADGGHLFNGNIRPNGDGVESCGIAAARWNTVYAVTGTINTSDERYKEDIDGIDDRVLDAWATVNYVQYRMSDAVKEKGGGARVHFGVIAQRIKEAFESAGLDPFAYGVLCYDRWDAEDAVVTPDGQVAREAIEAGDRYSVRYEEALVLEAALMRRTQERLLKRLDDIG